MAKAIPVSDATVATVPAPAAEILMEPVAAPVSPRAVAVAPASLDALASELGGVVVGNAVRVDH